MSDLGFEPVVRSLLEVRDLPGVSLDLTDIAALAFTSRNGVAAFARQSDRRDLPVFTVGDATAEAARGAGFETVNSAGGDLADLAALLGASAIDGGVLVSAALQPAGDLAALVSGVKVRVEPVYEAVETGVPAPDAVDAVLLHSARAARALANLWPSMTSLPKVFALSPAVAEPLQGLTEPTVAARPDEDALLQTLGKPAPRV